MKNILLASTALVAFAGAAAADVTLSGNAELGLLYGDTPADGIAPTDDEVEFFTDIDVTFTMSGETDNGLTFGASVDLDEGGDGSDASDNNREDGGATIFISGAFGTLTGGDTDGALDWALTEVAFNSGTLNDDETEHAGYNGNGGLDATFDNQVVRYDYTFGDFGIALSAEIDDGRQATDEASTILGIGARYGLDLGGTTVSFGLGYQRGENVEVDDNDNDNPLDDLAFIDDAEAIGASIAATFGAFSAGLSYVNLDDDMSDANSYDHFGIGVGYSVGAIALSANYGEYDYDDDSSKDGFGLSAGYDLGGGAIIQLGYGDSNFDDRGVDDYETLSFGVRMNF